MKANSPSDRGLLRLPLVLAIVIAMPLLAARAADDGISRDDLDRFLRAAQDKANTDMVVGTWKNTDLRMSMTFSERGQCVNTLGEKGLYKVKANADGVIVSVIGFEGKNYFSVTPISKDRATWAPLESPTDKPDPSKASVWTRGEDAPEAKITAALPNAKGKEILALQTPTNLIGKWKCTRSDDVVTTMSFSKSGEFELDYGQKDGVTKFNYTVQAVDGQLRVTVKSALGDSYSGIAFLSKDRCVMQKLESPTARIDLHKTGNILTRIPDSGISKDDLDSAVSAAQDKMNTDMIVGTWKNSDLKMSMTFSEGAQFALTREKNGENKVEKGIYSIKANGDGIIVTAVIFEGMMHFSVKPISKDRATWQELKSATDDKPDPSKASVWTRGEGTPEAKIPAAPPNAKGKELLALQTPANLIGKWKSTVKGVATTTSFSKSGEFDYAHPVGPLTVVGKGTYTAQAVDGGLLVTVKEEGEETVYLGMAFLSKDRCFVQRLKTPTDRIDTDKAGIIQTRIPIPADPPNATGKELLALQTPANLIGKWKSTGPNGKVATMSFSKSGEFELAKEIDGPGVVFKGTYTAQAVHGGLLVTLKQEGVKTFGYWGIAFMSKDRCLLQVSESPTDRIDPDKPGGFLIRIP